MAEAPTREMRRWLEWVVLAILLMIFIVLAIKQLWQLRVAAEQTNLAYMVGSLRSALGIHAAVRVLEDGADAAAEELAGSNPMTLMDQKRMRARYAGELNAPAPEAIDGRTWYFDTATGELVYRVDSEEYFLTPLPGPARVRFRIEMSYSDLNRNGQFDRKIDIVKGIALRQLDSFRWLETED